MMAQNKMMNISSGEDRQGTQPTKSKQTNDTIEA